MNAKQICGVIVAVCVAVLGARADSLELRNGSLIKGKFMGATQTSINFQAGSSVQSYEVADVRSLRFDSDGQGASPWVPSKQPTEPSAIEKDEVATSSSSVTIPAGTRISIRTIDAIDSTKNRVGYRFQASLEQPLWVDGNVVVPKGADIYGRLEQSKATGTFTGTVRTKTPADGNCRPWPDCAASHRRIRSLRQIQRREYREKNCWEEPPLGASSVRLQPAGKGRPSAQEQGRAWELPRKLSPRETK